jgi:hypothetical protein
MMGAKYNTMGQEGANQACAPSAVILKKLKKNITNINTNARKR